MKTYVVEQGSRAWHAVRRGRPTASQFHRIITPGTLKPSKQSEAYMLELLAERFTALPPEDDQGGITTHLMQRGTDLEPKAAEFYELTNGVELQVVGFMTTDDGRYGCSIDRLVSPDGILEIKCPGPKRHIENLLAGHGIGTKYRLQQQGQMLVAERDWCDGISYHPTLPDSTVRTRRDEKVTRALRLALDSFCRDMETEAERLIELGCEPVDHSVHYPTPIEDQEDTGDAA